MSFLKLWAIPVPPSTRRYTATPKRMMVEPEGMSKIQERNIPLVVRIMLIIVALTIIPFRVLENGRMIAAGRVSRAMTRIIPTTWINTTTDIAMRSRTKR